ncbi:MAG: hypothetical protein BGP12_00080 [Rhodospirillales bacterium 70-18]|nr:MAG: hypothetical protein BGP12_00080 [Rhodospirillales bacterium 70-18]
MMVIYLFVFGVLPKFAFDRFQCLVPLSLFLRYLGMQFFDSVDICHLRLNCDFKVVPQCAPL